MQDTRVKPVPITVEMSGQRLRVPSREEAELMAYQLLRDERIQRPPVDPYELAAAVGIYDVVFGEIRRAAVTIQVPGVSGVGVILRREDSSRRRRFSLAHEIGHRRMHPDVVAHSNITRIAARGGQDALERVVDHFAACLLMPRLWLGDAVRDGRALLELVRLFDVSGPAMERRLRELGYEEAIR